MGVIYAGYFFNSRYAEAGQYCIKVYSADAIHFFEKQKKEQTDIVFCIKEFPFIKKAPDSFLDKLFLCQWDRAVQSSSQQHRIKAIFSQ